MSNISRRNLFKTAGAGVLAFGSGAVLAQTSNPANPYVPQKWDESYDVVVVGGGGAGMAAALLAAQNGAKVVIIEKLLFAGGNTMAAQGQINAADPVRQPKQNIEDSPEKHAAQTLAAGDFRGDPARVKVLCDNAYSVITWLEGLGMEFKPTVHQMFGGLYPRAHSPAVPKGIGYTGVLSKALKKENVPFKTSFSVVEIYREQPWSGDVLGVKVQNSKGQVLNIEAKKGVVLASGGFSGNQYLRELHDPRTAGLGTDNLPGHTGDVMMAANRIGGYLIGMDFIQSTPGAPAGKKMKIILNTNVDGSIYVDKRGNRIRDAVLGTPERYGYTVVDNNQYESYNSAVHDAVQRGIEINEAWTAPTIKELAVKMGVDPEGLQKTVDRYNNVIIKNKEDPDFHKAPRNLTRKIEKGPFWACYTGMTVHHTMGGLNTNTKAQVLDCTGTPIPRLYAAGEITGGIHGTNRVGGNALLDCFVFGRIAGENVAKEKARS